jgi:cell division protein YceG involved in septum cleavage
MKSLFTVALASVLSFGAFSAQASEDLRELSAVNTNYKKVTITLKEGIGAAKVSILTPEGRILSSRKVNVHDSILRLPYDLTNLPAGKYQVKIATSQDEVSYTVETANQPIPTSDLPLMAYGKSLDHNTVRLAVFGLMEPGVQVKIFASESGRLIHEENIDQPEGFIKNFSFAQMSSDEIYMVVSDAEGRTKTLYF